MRIAIFGLGYVGTASAACLADMGHDIVGVELNPVKLQMINEGKSPIIEKGLNEILGKNVHRGKLKATSDWLNAVQSTEMAMVCVGTPSRTNGSIDLNSVLRVCEQIGQALATKQDYYTVVVRSTVIPGTVEEMLIPMLQKHSGKKAGLDYGVCMNPEFLREGSSVADFFHPPKTVIGEFDERSGKGLSEIYSKFESPLIRTEIRVAEMVKYADNAYHALKICYANEIGNICKRLEIDGHKVMDIFCTDTKLNISSAYLKPGFAFGGSCLPKDLRSISYLAKMHDIDIPLLNSILVSNKCQILNVITKLMSYKGRSLGFLGLSFKEGTDDLRESPIVEVIETMIGKGFDVRIYDQNVSLARIMGANKEYIRKEIPHISDLLCSSIKDVVDKSDVLVIANNDKEFIPQLHAATETKVIVDLVRLFETNHHSPDRYYGLCW